MCLKSIICRRSEPLPWLGFSLGQSHSCADYIFFYDVRTDKKGHLLLTGECRNKKGKRCRKEQGVRLRKRTVAALKDLRLEELPKEKQEDIPPELEEVFQLDASESYFTLILPDGRQEKKEISEAIFLDIANLLRAYII